MKRRTDPEWLARERERRRIYGKNRIRNKQKYSEYARIYRLKPENQLKEKARAKVGWAIDKGTIVVPEVCDQCGQEPKPFKDGRRALRADHFKGYNFPLVVKFICVNCDGEQLRAKNKTL